MALCKVRVALRILVVTLRNTGNSGIARVCKCCTSVFLDITRPTERSVQVDKGVAVDRKGSLGISVVDHGGCGGTAKGTGECLQVGTACCCC